MLLDGSSCCGIRNGRITGDECLVEVEDLASPMCL